MAMELATAAMTPLLEQLGSLLASELTLETRVRQDVASLRRELAEMELALRRVAAVPPDRLDQRTVLWARDVRELAYDMEDAVDAFTLRVDDPAAGHRSRLRVLLGRTARLFSNGKALHQVAGAVRDAKDLARELGELRQRYAGLTPQDAASGGASYHNEPDPRLRAMFTEAADLVGVDAAREVLARLLLSADRSEVDVKTVSIFGFGGLGKTTLAKAVYDKIRLHFDCWAFVSVSRNPEIARVLKTILFQLDEERFADINEAVRDYVQLTADLKGFLHNKRYLIVIDDLWDERNWEFIKCAFPKNTCSSRLITTSRKRNVSEASCSSDGDKVYEMKPLSEEDSLRLFHSRVFHRGNTCPPELEQVSRDILKKCGGVPLAITTVASLLASHGQVKPKDQWLVLLNSIGHGLELEGRWKVEDMHKILSLSYYDLPSHLKPCLLYLSVFPEDYDIERDRLIWRWIAEGFIQHSKDNSEYDNLFEIGESYFVELVNRGMVQPVPMDLEGRAQACRVHDVVLDLIRSLSSKENFVTVWDGGDQKIRMSPNNSMPRRLSILQSSATTTASMSKVRSFTIFNPAVDSMPSLSEFQVLRVLDFEGCDLTKCGGHLNLKHVGKLVHLRYLGLRRTRIRELPGEVGKLQFLQTLDVRGSHGVQELPQTITGLRKLMLLRLDWDTRLPNGFGSLTSLEELTGLRIGGDDSAAAVVSELGGLAGLRVLTARWESPDVAEDLVRSLGNLRTLRSLDLYVNGGRGDVMRDWAPPPRLRRFVSKGPTGALPTLPAWTRNRGSSSSSSLTFLDICVTKVGRDDLQAHGALPSLRGVRLRAAVGGIVGGGGRYSPLLQEPERTTAVVRADAFPCARACAFLHFATAPSMFPRGAMPRVRRLDFSLRAWDVVASCGGGGGGLGLDDLRMGHLPSLEEVHVELWCRREDDAAVAERVEAALRGAAQDHPNGVALRIVRRIRRMQRSHDVQRSKASSRRI